MSLSPHGYVRLVDLDPDGPVPLYQQLAALLAAQIRSGDLAPGRPIPSKTTLKQTFGISDATVNAAVGVLRDDGLVTGVQGKGIYVTDPSCWPQS